MKIPQPKTKGYRKSVKVPSIPSREGHPGYFFNLNFIDDKSAKMPTSWSRNCLRLRSYSTKIHIIVSKISKQHFGEQSYMSIHIATLWTCPHELLTSKLVAPVCVIREIRWMFRERWCEWSNATIMDLKLSRHWLFNCLQIFISNVLWK